MFKNLARTLQHIALSRLAVAQPSLPVPQEQLSARELSFTGRGKGGKHSSKPSGAAQLKRAATKANNIHKFNK